MEHVRMIVLYGNSVSVSALAAGLDAQPGCRVARVEACATGAIDQVRLLHPDVLVFDLAATQPESAIELLREFPELQLIGVDLAAHRALVLCGEQPRLLTTDDLLRLIEEQPE